MLDKPNLLFVINSSLTSSLLDGVNVFFQENGSCLNIKIISTTDVEDEVVGQSQLSDALKKANMVFLDIRGSGKAASICAKTLVETSQPVALLLGPSPDLMHILRLGSFSLDPAEAAKRGKPPAKDGSVTRTIPTMQNFMQDLESGNGSENSGEKMQHARNWVQIMEYWQQGGGENIKNLLCFAAKTYLEMPFSEPEQPRKYPEFGIYDPLTNDSYDSLSEYKKNVAFDKDKPTVGLLFYGGMHFSQSLVPAKGFAVQLREMGLNVVPVFSTSANNLTAIQSYFFDNALPVVDAVVYFQWFQLTTFSGDTDSEMTSIELLQKLNVPVFSGCPMYGREIEKWEECIQGLSPIEALTTVILPELDGMIEPIPSAGLVEVESELVDGSIKQVQAMENRIHRACNRIKRWATLRKKQNAEKRVAFIVYDNPPGEDNLGNAAYLDTFASLKVLFETMRQKGYFVKDVPDSESLSEYMLKRRLVNNLRWGGEDIALKEGQRASVNEYLSFLSKTGLEKQMLDDWGVPPGEIMNMNGNFMLPATAFGNILLGVQPARGVHSDPDKITHDKTLAPHHQYVAFYRWLEEVWKADCVVHVGTHGTIEFLKGKEMGTSQHCFPEALIGNVPHLYFYHVINAAEATIAKRRSLGVLVNYNSPSFAAGGLYDEYDSLDNLISECLEARIVEPIRAERLEKRVLEKATELHLGADSLEEIQEEITLMKRSIIPKGLHLLGEGIAEQDRAGFASFFLRYDRGQIPSLHRQLAEKQGLDYEALLCPTQAKDGTEIPSGALEDIDNAVEKIVQAAWDEGVFPEEDLERKAVENAIKVAKKLDGDLEFENFLKGLNGEYIEPAIGGDALRNPEVLPTGRNSYQFDPRLVPSEESCKRGIQIANNTLEHYKKLHGKYPDSTAVILWGFETTKTRGETVGQILGYLGVRIIQSSSPYHKKIEAIPLAELGRPRIDCLVQICGFFRDMYSNVLDMINRAFRLVSELDEAEQDNYVRNNTLKLKSTLAGKVAEDKLDVIAAGRVFGPRAGEYGTRTTHLIETAAWEDEEEIASLFTSSMSHLYAGKIHGERQLDAYRGRLEKVDVVSQVRDCHEYEIMDLDHYYEYFGGLSRTVESVKGEAPVMLITDTTKEVIRTETVGESLNRGIRTRLLNPKWIDALLEHEYHGVQKIGDRVENLIGFAATTHAVENWVWSAVFDRYVRDNEMFARMAENNRFATEEILNRLNEAQTRGYWNATDEEMELLKEQYLDLEGKIEESTEQ